jgi:ribose transport system permease protein
MRISREQLARFQSLVAFGLLVIGFSIASDQFLTVDNGLNVLRQISINLCLSIGMTMIILSGGIDLSVGSVLALSGAVAAGLLKNGLALPGTGYMLEFTAFGACIAGIFVGMVLGWHNAFFITWLGVPPFIATLAMLTIARGLTMLWMGGFPITGLGAEFNFIGVGYWLGVPMPVWFSAVLAAIFVVVTRRTRFGRYLYAVGGNERAALLSGVNVRRVKSIAYILGGALAAVAGLLLSARLDAADPRMGMGYELDAIAAVVIGGTSLSGGRGSIMGTVLGCLIIGVLNNGLVLLDVSPYWQLVIKGYVILLAVAIDRTSRRE